MTGFHALLSVLVFASFATETAAYRVAAGGTVFRYEYQAIFPNLSPVPQLRAYHTSEIPLIFGTYNLGTDATSIPSTATDIALSQTVQRTWVSIAQNPENGLTSLGWPKYEP
ncbi:hypothetical protein GYMLUDRAFT_239626 [Collybiopsis luxurians FD-317 M1]|nr:hypothetical protein GYMLUDRAFT_239626 [Collybiopsis luxurians FD-317 M1]